MTNTKERSAGLAVFFITFIWGTTFPLIKFIGAVMDPVPLLFYRFMIAACVLGIYLLFTGAELLADLKEGLITGVLLWLIFIPQMVGLRYTTASNSAFITSLFVAFVPAFSFLFTRQLPNVMQVFAGLIALVGLWFLTGGIANAGKGDIITLGTAVSCGAYISLVDVYSKRVKSPFVMSFQQFVVAGVLSFFCVKFGGLTFAIPTWTSLWATAYLGVFATFVCLTVQVWAQQYLPPFKASLIFTIEPVIAAFIAWRWLGETFRFAQAIGACLIIIAMIVAVLPVRRFVEQVE